MVKYFFSYIIKNGHDSNSVGNAVVKAERKFKNHSEALKKLTETVSGIHKSDKNRVFIMSYQLLEDEEEY